jgi:hypothetical protein
MWVAYEYKRFTATLRQASLNLAKKIGAVGQDSALAQLLGSAKDGAGGLEGSPLTLTTSAG